MFAVDGQHAHAVFADGLHDRRTGADQCLFVGQGDVTAGFDSRERRFNAAESDEADISTSLF